jgi:hypothetical protein
MHPLAWPPGLGNDHEPEDFACDLDGGVAKVHKALLMLDKRGEDEGDAGRNDGAGRGAGWH